MERAIKFRGKRIDNGEWVYDDLVHHYSIKNGERTDHVSIGIDLDFYEIIPETVGQLTGLKDKNGVDIYEGDIIEHSRGGRYIVSYGIQEIDAFEGVGFNLWDFYGEYSDIGKAVRLQSSVEVIGNTHDNPELLK